MSADVEEILEFEDNLEALKELVRGVPSNAPDPSVYGLLCQGAYHLHHASWQFDELESKHSPDAMTIYALQYIAARKVLDKQPVNKDFKDAAAPIIEKIDHFLADQYANKLAYAQQFAGSIGKPKGRDGRF